VEVVERVMVRFDAEGSGEAEMSWGQLEIWGAMERQQTMMPLHVKWPLAPGTTLADIADWLRYQVSRHQAMRTLLQFPAEGTPRQVVYDSGEIAMDLIEAGTEDPADVADQMCYVVADYFNHEYDATRDLPVLVSVILRDGVPAITVFTVCHIVLDASGGLALAADLAERDAGRPGQPVTALQPLEQARWQRSRQGQRHGEAVLRHWADQLRRMPAQRFPGRVDRGQPRYWRVRFASPATYLAVRVIQERTGVGSPQVLLALFLVALAQVTGINPAVARVAVNNRFRPELTDSVSLVNQYGLCVVDVADVTFDEALRRLGKRIFATMKNAYYDPLLLAELVERVGLERGEEVDVHCYYNDRRLSLDSEAPAGARPTAEQIRAAVPLATTEHEPMTYAAERLFAAIEAAEDTVQLSLEADTHYLSQEAMAACAAAIERVAVAAATDPAAPTNVPAAAIPIGATGAR
jgi:hypothetical protein